MHFILNIHRHVPIGTHPSAVVVGHSSSQIATQAGQEVGKCPNRNAGRMRERFFPIWRPFVEKCYVLEFIRFLLFPVQTAGARVYTPTQDASLTNLHKQMLTYFRYGHYSCGTVKRVMHIFLRAGKSQVFTCCSLHCCKMLLHKAPDNILQIVQAL